MQVKPCIPPSLPLPSLDWSLFIDGIGKAHATLARLDEVISSVESPQSVFSLLINEECVDSLQFQKVSVTLEDFLYANALKKKEHEKKLEKISNYQKALTDGMTSIVSEKISFSLLCNLHKTIKKGSQELTKDMGKFRDRQNWIGPEGCGMKESYFLPPDVKNLHKGMLNLKKYLSYKEKDPLVHLAIFFANLLILHPFMDGNGRVARILIPLFLYQKKILSHPMFFMSAYFKKHRLPYFEKLFTITSDNNWEGWIQFFLKGILEEGENSLKKAKHLLAIYQKFQKEVKNPKILDPLFAFPLLDRNEWEKRKKLFNDLKKLEEKKWISAYKEPSMVAVKELLTIDSCLEN